MSSSNIDHLINKIHTGKTPNFLTQLDSDLIALTLTSPPYYDTELYMIEGEAEFGWEDYDDYFIHIKNTLKELYRITIPGGRAVFVLSNTPQTNPEGGVTHYWPIYADLISEAVNIGWNLQDEIIWYKNIPSYDYLDPGFVPETQLNNQHDSIGVLRKPGPPRIKTNKKFEFGSVWEFPAYGPIKEYNKMYPSFPTELVQRIIKIWSLHQDIVLDPYAGSGQVIREAISLDRFGIGVEVDERWEKLWDDI